MTTRALHHLAAKRAEAEARLSELTREHDAADVRIRELSMGAPSDPETRGEIAGLERENARLRREREWLEATLAEIDEIEAVAGREPGAKAG